MEMITLPSLIEDDVFNVNKNLNINVKETSWGNYIEIDNFWEYPEKIHEIALKIPCTRLQGIYDVEENGKDYFDGRSYFNFHKEILFHDVLVDVITKIYSVSHLDHQNLSLGNNIFNWNRKCFLKNKDNGYSPHSDGDNVIACLWYMNSEYDKTDGTGIYSNIGKHSKQSPWIDNSNLIDVLEAFPNRLVIYDGAVSHSSIVGERWINDVRHSMVHFLEYK